MRRFLIVCLLFACERSDSFENEVAYANALSGVSIDDTHGNPVVRDIPSGRINVASKRALDETTLTADEMLRRVQSAYLGGMKRCYASGLQMEATARGRVTLKFQVIESGRVENATANGFAKHIDTCLVERMNAWVFVLVPKDKSGEPTKASFELVLEFVPS